MLFKSITDVKEHSECGAITFASLKKSILLAEVQYIMPLLGQALYTTLNDAYAAAPGTTLAEELTGLLYAVQEALAPLTLYIYIPKAELQLSDAGAC